MQAVRLSSRSAARFKHGVPLTLTRALSTPSSSSEPSLASFSASQNRQPWFVDDTEPIYATPRPQSIRNSPAFSPLLPSLPPTIPDELKELHSALALSPHLEPSALVVRRPLPTPPGPPPLEEQLPKGRRKRGRTYVGEGVRVGNGLLEGGIWSWVVLAQVKEGTENRGAIESVVRIVRKTLLGMNPPLPLPPNSRRKISDGWAMIDAGDFAVHVLSLEARLKFFTDRSQW
ncbi:uncharacterized protein STEHIDRAFT_93176 [Stereum hirsutum FP-91666 SS1]|uniref:uncharacterized protein n=1 Tax=Stereum hirsutum (strain FP-91666) TaxID=721885 RepID=UPI000440F6A3|nr:uncharacterized protein STEHIDRAFT_93176 [Stereum hirsutum FP-91666 SS1]EIM90294.1 hypothetical protein STEHIDRAFT_93176 [Stereum hirsutum FP-91666 SS1]